MLRLRAADLSWQRLEEDVVVLDLRGGNYLTVNGSGAMLWEILADGAERESLVDALREQFDLEPERAAQDVDEFVRALSEAGLLE